MKRTFILGMTALSLAMLLVRQGTGLDRLKVKDEIRNGVGHFLNPEADSADCTAAFLRLVGTIERAAPESGFPASFGEAVSKARGLFESTSILSPDGIRLLREAYLSANEGRPFIFPEGLTGIASIRAHAGRLSEDCLRNLDAGRTGAAVKGVLEILLLIVTPVEATR